MRADEQTYRDVAKNCSAYEVKDCCSCSNKSGNVNVSCVTCKHFTSDKHCSLDLFDPIVETTIFRHFYALLPGFSSYRKSRQFFNRYILKTAIERGASSYFFPSTAISIVFEVSNTRFHSLFFQFPGDKIHVAPSEN